MKQLYFIRHGESVLNKLRVFAGQTDTPLTPLGREQAMRAAAQLKDIDIDLIISSPLSRTLETAQILAQIIGYPNDKILTNDTFKERSLGTLEGKSWDEYDEATDENNGAESDDALLRRAQNGLEFLYGQPAETILLVGHGSFARALRTAIDPSQQYSEPENATVMRLI